MPLNEDPLAKGDRLARAGDRAAAIASYDIAADGAPITARARAVELLLELGQLEGALERAEAAWRVAPDAPEALYLMGRVAWRVRAVKEALTCLDRIPESSELWPAAQAERAEALLAGRRADEAYADIRRALAQRNDSPALWLAMGHVLMALERLEEAEDAYRRTVDWLPTSTRGLAGIAEVCLRLGRPDEAISAGERAVAVSNGNPVARTVLAHALLAVGRDTEAWPAFEARFEAHALDRRVGVKPRSFELPAWEGGPLGGSPLLVWGEGTPSDEAYFAGLIPELAARDSHPLIIECDPRLLGLFRRSFPEAGVIPRSTPPDTALSDRPPACQVAIGSLPYRLDAAADGYAKVRRGYLKADDAKVQRWRSRWEEGAASRVIGLAWRHPDPGAERRSVPLAPLLDALSAPGRVLVSLQRGMTDDEREAAGVRMRVEPDWDANDVDDLTARAAACDVVVTIDVLVAHLAAGAGVDTRVLLDVGADARWGGGRARTPWYSTVRLYWQDRRGGWTRTIGELRKGVDGG